MIILNIAISVFLFMVVLTGPVAAVFLYLGIRDYRNSRSLLQNQTRIVEEQTLDEFADWDNRFNADKQDQINQLYGWKR